MRDPEKRREAALRKELEAVVREEEKLMTKAEKRLPPAWKEKLEKMVPPKVYEGLETAFCKAFSLVFREGSLIVEKSMKKEDLEADHKVQDYAFQLTGRRKDLKKLQKMAKQSDLINLSVTTVEGVGLGLLGIGLPDIVLFLATLLRGIYEMVLSYGFTYDSTFEKYVILKIMENALTMGENWGEKNAEIDSLVYHGEKEISEEEFEAQLERTASAFAVDMLLLKFIQGFPLAGLAGGVANPVYYRKVMKYAEIKYRKRYLFSQVR